MEKEFFFFAFKILFPICLLLLVCSRIYSRENDSQLPIVVVVVIRQDFIQNLRWRSKIINHFRSLIFVCFLIFPYKNNKDSYFCFGWKLINKLFIQFIYICYLINAKLLKRNHRTYCVIFFHYYTINNQKKNLPTSS